MDVFPVLIRFIESFKVLDIEAMMSCFAEDSTSFFPSHHYSSKIVGKSQIRARFEQVINKIKAAGLTQIALPVEDLDTMNYGETALATFHIRDSDLSRRTVVLRKNEDEWLISHLHASNAPLEDAE
jgi:ketosteroid isomerase-like protein